MSKDNQPTNLRLLGSPVNLTYRAKKKEDKKNIRNRPRSALHNSSYIPDYQERYKRPFSADTKVRSSSANNLLKPFNIEVIPCNTSASKIIIVPPTAEILGKSKSFDRDIAKHEKDLCSNASDYGSEDTFVSLGTKIKARAQVGPKIKHTNKDYLKYRDIAKAGKNCNSKINGVKMNDKSFDVDVKITENVQDENPSPVTKDGYEPYNLQTTYRTPSCESYFLSFESEEQRNGDKEFSHDPNCDNLTNDVEQAIDTYTRRLKLTKQQLSLVEEESTQDFSSLSPENSITNQIPNTEDCKDNVNKDNQYSRNLPNLNYNSSTQNLVFDRTACEPRTYKNFYDDFEMDKTESYKSHLCSTVLTDSSSKDSGYTDSGSTREKSLKRLYSLPNSVSMVDKGNSSSNPDEEPNSIGSSSLSSRIYKTYLSTYPPNRKKYDYAEPLNHSRLLYKDFFLRKEGNGPNAPHNSPSISENNDNTVIQAENTDYISENKTSEYPTYLLNSTTKAYTSKVIEDYKKEIEAINNLHELTIKDIKIESISPTPLNIDKLFEDKYLGSTPNNYTPDLPEYNSTTKVQSNGESYHTDARGGHSASSKRDVAEISTKELIHNYLKVKDNDYNKDSVTKGMKKGDRKSTNLGSDSEKCTKSLNNSLSKSRPGNSAFSTLIKNQTQINCFSVRAPSLSARIESVQNDKDIDSWMSLSVPTPRSSEIKNSESNVLGDTFDVAGNKEGVTSPKKSNNSFDLSKDGTKFDTVTELDNNSTVLDIYSMLKEIERYGDNPVNIEPEAVPLSSPMENEENTQPKDNFTEIFEFLEKVEQSANEALSVVTNTTPPSIPKLDILLRLPQTELAQRLVTASLQLEERSCCIALLQESLTNHKQQMVTKVGSLEKHSTRNINKVKQECEEAIKRHQSFIDQLINDKKTLNHRIEQLVDERRTLEDRWKRSAQALEDRYKLELKNQHDKMAAAQQVARQRWVRQKAEKIKELTVKGLEGELREMADRQQKEIADVKMYHAEHMGRVQAKHAADMEEQRRTLEEEKEAALLKERQLASSRLEKQILELELTYQEQRTRLVAEIRAENERVASGLTEREKNTRIEIEKWREEQEKLIEEKKVRFEQDIAQGREKMEEEIKEKRAALEDELERYKKLYETEQQAIFKRREKEIAAQYKLERDKEIEKAIESMESEAQTGRKELQEALRRNKEQYELELKELAETEQATLKRYQDTQARVRQTEDRCANLEVTISQLETRNRLLSEKNNQLEQRVEEIRTSSEEAWRLKVDNVRKEMEDAKKVHEEQMHQLYAKVKIAVARKDSAIQALTRETSKAQEKITLLEQKLNQQRKDFLKHK